MISKANLESSNLSKGELTDMVRFMEANPKEISKYKKIESRSKLNLTKIAKKDKSKGNLRNDDREQSVCSIEILASRTQVKSGLCAGCCPKKNKRAKMEENAISQWAKKYCRNPEDLFGLMKLTTENIRGSLDKLKSLRRLLLYENDPDAEAQGLSRIGGQIWLLTFAVQHLIDPEHLVKDLPHELLKIRVIYQEIGASSQQFLLMGEKFYAKIDEMRDTSIAIIKNLQKLLRGQGLDNPFLRRPENFYRKHKVISRRRVGQQKDFNLDSDQSIERVDVDETGTFQVHWTPLNIVYKDNSEDSWKNFAFIGIEQKLSIFKEFAKSCLAFLETLIQKFSCETTNILSITMSDFSSEDIATTLIYVTGGILNFLEEGNCKKYFKPSTSSSSRRQAQELSKIERWSSILVDFWLQIDFLYEVTYDLTLLIEESRDAVRTCYAYTVNFYHWKLCDFDDFDPATKTSAYKRDMKRIHDFITRLLNHRSYSDAALFLSLADFTSSVYQDICKRHEVEANGQGMRMKLEPHIFDEPSETWGLVSDDHPEVVEEIIRDK